MRGPAGEQVNPSICLKHQGLYFTRWVTHFMLGVPVFLAGELGRPLSLQAGRSRNETTRFLLIRGLWLVVLEPSRRAIRLVLQLWIRIKSDR